MAYLPYSNRVLAPPPAGHLTVTDLVERWGVARKTVYRWIEIGALKAKNFDGPRWCVPLKTVVAFEKRAKGLPKKRRKRGAR